MSCKSSHLLDFSHLAYKVLQSVSREAGGCLDASSLSITITCADAKANPRKTRLSGHGYRDGDHTVLSQRDRLSPAHAEVDPDAVGIVLSGEASSLDRRPETAVRFRHPRVSVHNMLCMHGLSFHAMVLCRKDMYIACSTLPHKTMRARAGEFCSFHHSNEYTSYFRREIAALYLDPPLTRFENSPPDGWS